MTNTLGWAGRPCKGPGCDRLLRSKNYPIEQAPNMHAASGHQMCARCYMRAKDAPAQAGSEDAAVVEQHAADLEAYFARRRARGIPVAGARLQGAGNGP